MTYLSRLVLNPRSRAVQRDLADCQQMHRSIQSAFPEGEGVGRAANAVLFRVDDAHRLPRVLVQSSVEPDWTLLRAGYLAEPPGCKRVDRVYSCLDVGQRVRFRLRANPTKRVLREGPRPGAEKNWTGKRVNLTREEDQINWLRRRGEQGGFELLAAEVASELGTERREAYSSHSNSPPCLPDVEVRPSIKLHGYRTGSRLTFGSAVFEGELRITDADRFRDTLIRGIGSGKAYGFGLLSIAPA